MTTQSIPFTRPFLTGREIEYVTAAITALELVGDGPNTRIVEQRLSELSGGVHAFFTPSCTDALDMAGLCLELQPGDEVIVPSFTFTSTATAFALRGATIVFADVDPLTMNCNPAHVGTLITDKTKAIVVVHYAGIACDMTAFEELARANNLALIEDNAHGLGGEHQGRPLGSIGDMATLSFHATKNLQCGEGGAFLTRRADLEARAHILREKGTNRRAFLDGAVDKYTWVDHGSSFLAADYVAAFLKAQLEEFDAIQASRITAWQRYAHELTAWAHDRSISLPHVPDYTCPTGHIFWIRFDSPDHRPSFMKFLKDRGIGTTFHYQSLSASPAGKRFGRVDSHGTPVSDAASATLVRLPLFSGMRDAETDQVISAVLEWSP